MCRKLFILTVFTLLLGMSTSSQAGLDDDPNLVAWWKFDGDATDSSGNELHGTLMGNPAPTFVNGMIGQALDTTELDGPGYVEITGYQGILGGNPFSITAWINTSDSSGTFMGWGSTDAGTTRFEFRPDADELRSESSGNVQGLTNLPDNEWIHIAVTVRADANITEPDVTLYLNGQVDNDPATGSNNPLEMAAGFDVTIARRHSGAARWLDALIDDVRLYSRELTAEEIKELATPQFAHNPSPVVGEVLSDTWISLGWSTSYHAISHDMYVGTNFDDVNDSTGETFQGNQTDNTIIMGIVDHLYPEGLPLGTTFYWRVDEVLANGTKQRGDVWSFFVPPINAYNPNPLDGMKFIPTDTTLTWDPGMKPVFHNVYIGENFEDVNNAAGGPPVFDMTYIPETLERDKTYYWRVDKFSGTETVKGDVWSFTTIEPIAVSDPNLVGWWKFDEGMGSNVVDYSGYDHHGKIQGDTVWNDGYDLGALEFDGSGGDFVETTDFGGITGTNPRTCCAWIKTSMTGNHTIMSWGQNLAGQKWRMRVEGADGVLRAEVNGGYLFGVTPIANGYWHHVAVTFEDDGTPDVLDTRLYVDGLLDGTADSLDEPIDTVEGPVRIGESPWHNSPFEGVIDEARIYDKALTQEEIQLAMRIDLQRAWGPSPADGSLVPINMASPLKWSAGDGMSQHDVYLGPDEAAVAAADASDANGVYRGRQSDTSYVPSEGVDPNSGPFYWRIDEIADDGTIVAGRIWTYFVTDYALVDDFESYSSDNPIWENWLDGVGFGVEGTPDYYPGNGTGSAAGDDTIESYAEEVTVHSGRKAMPVWYNNTTAAISEIEKTLSPAQDWTANDLKTLSLRFVGAVSNVPGQLYVKVNGVQVDYPGDAGNLTLAGWQSWNIDLELFGGGLENVTKVVIGVKGNGATGKLIFDDIRLYTYTCESITPVQPDPEGLVLHYEFEGNANDSTGANPGTAFGGAIYLPGKIGQAITLDGIDDYVAIDNLFYDSNDYTEISVCAWILTNFEENQVIVAFDRSEYYRLQINGEGGGPGEVGWSVLTGADIVDYEPAGGNSTRVDDNQWHHIVGVFDNGKLTVYIDGNPQIPAFGEPVMGTSLVRFGYIGVGSEAIEFNGEPRTPAEYFSGSIDDFRIYHRALTDGEVAGLAGRTGQFDKPF